ncbi:MAG TPA: DUF4115 domain-containing protein [Thiobacillaceae bacterium]|nr:DUF4115 domain-containing protein [Thiobacillaceae bacterium]
MNEAALESIGQRLRSAREATGMSREDAALRLRLMQRQIEAMETDDFESLGEPVFARGFVRNYARLLGLAPEGLLSRMEGAPAEPAAVSKPAPALPRSWLSSPWLILFLLALLVLVAVPAALYLWLNSEVADGPVRAEPVVAPLQPTPAPVPAAVEAPATPAPGRESEQEPGVTPDGAQIDTPGAGASVPVNPARAGSVLHLEFGTEAWTEIRDASGRMLHRQLDAAGTQIDVAGQPPFDVVIGNAPEARLTYNGRPIDLKPFTDGKVARFTLEE